MRTRIGCLAVLASVMGMAAEAVAMQENDLSVSGNRGLSPMDTMANPYSSGGAPLVVEYWWDSVYGGYLDGGAADVIYAGNGNDIVWTQDGNDAAFGERGNDTLVGGDGNDVLLGGDDNDVLWGDNTNAGAALTPGDEWMRWRGRAATVNSNAANDEAINAWRIAA